MAKARYKNRSKISVIPAAGRRLASDRRHLTVHLAAAAVHRVHGVVGALLRLVGLQTVSIRLP